MTAVTLAGAVRKDFFFVCNLRIRAAEHLSLRCTIVLSKGEMIGGSVHQPGVSRASSMWKASQRIPNKFFASERWQQAASKVSDIVKEKR